MRSVLVALSLLAVAACSRTPEETATSDDALVSGGVCSTLDYGKTAPASAYYEFFADDAEAAAFFARKDSSPAAGPFQEISHDPTLTRLVAEVFAGFQKAFPKETEGLTAPPPIAVVKNDTPNAYAIGPGAAGDPRAPWVFVVHTSIIDGRFSEDELRGVFAHELGHLILRTFTPEVQKRVQAVYQIGPEGEAGFLGAAQTDDPAIASYVEALLARQARVGSNVTLGYPIILQGSYGRIIDILLRSATPSDACTDYLTQAIELGTLQLSLLPNYKAGNFVPLTPTPEQRAELDRLSRLARQDISTCLADQFDDRSLAELATLFGQEPVSEETNNDHGPAVPLVDRLLAVQDVLQADLIEQRTHPRYPIENIRVFDFEEDADDASVRVLTAIGKNPIGNGEFLLDATLTPEDKAKCIADVAAGTPVPYGQLYDTHQPACWRYFHMQQFSKSLGTCPLR